MLPTAGGDPKWILFKGEVKLLSSFERINAFEIPPKSDDGVEACNCNRLLKDRITLFNTKISVKQLQIVLPINEIPHRGENVKRQWQKTDIQNFGIQILHLRPRNSQE
jgi:hypothetical protein